MVDVDERLPEEDLVSERFEVQGQRLLRTTSFREGRSVTGRASAGEDVDLQAAWWRAYLRSGLGAPEATRAVRAIDAFSGAGGLALGLRSAVQSLGADLDVVAAIDVDRGALAVHRHNHSTTSLITRSADLLVDSNVVGRGKEARFQYEPEVVDGALDSLVGNVDVIIAGPPCQGHSSLNNRSRHDDQRNSLYLTVPAMAIALGAPAVVIENVPGVVRDRSAVVASTMHLLRSHGYKLSTAILRAHRLGWPQTRKRFFMVALRDQAPVSLASQARLMDRDPLSLRWTIEDLMGRNDHPLLDGVPAYTDENLARMAYLIDQDETNLPNNIRPKSHQLGTTYPAVYGRLSWDEPAPTITTGFSTPGRGRFTHPAEPRTLTAREAARLQGFPDDYFSPEVLADVEANRGLISKWIGDAVPMPLGHVACLAAIAPFLAA